MKKALLAVCISVAGIISSYGQGIVVMNTAAVDAYLKFTNSATSTFFAGGPGVANIALYYATSSNTLASGGGTMVIAGSTNLSGVAWTVSSAFVATTSGGGNRQILSQAGLTTWFQLRAWSGNYATYEDAKASGLNSVLISQLLTDGTLRGAPIVSATPTALITDTASNIKWSPGSASANPFLVDGSCS